MKNLASLALTAVLIILPTADSFANTPSTKGQLTLSYSDGRPDSNGLKDVNAALMTAGVRVSTLPLPEAATPILEVSKTRAITKEETTKLISIFS